MGYGRLGIVLLFALLLNGNAHAFWFSNRAPQHSDLALITWCEDHLSNLTKVRHESDAILCGDTYFYNQNLEDPDLIFNKALRYFYRAIELNPDNHNTYTTAMWLRYSRWSAEKTNASLTSKFENELDAALKIAAIIELKFHDQAEALKSLADQLDFVREHHKPELLPWIQRLYSRAESISSDLKLRIRCLLNLGHLSRNQNQLTKAREYYFAVLKLDPNNKVAKRNLEFTGSGLLTLSHLPKVP